MPNPFHANPFECQHAGSPDERLALSLEQGVLLWCMRASVIGLKRGIDVEARIDGMLEALGAPAASVWLRQFVVALSAGCTRMIEVRCVCRKRLDPDERALLDVLSLAQAMRRFEALLVLRGFVTQAGAQDALRGAEGVGAALAQAGRFLPEPEQEVRHFAMTPDLPRLSPFFQTIH
jgi:hypothetical protein